MTYTPTNAILGHTEQLRAILDQIDSELAYHEIGTWLRVEKLARNANAFTKAMVDIAKTENK